MSNAPLHKIDPTKKKKKKWSLLNWHTQVQNLIDEYFIHWLYGMGSVSALLTSREVDTMTRTIKYICLIFHDWFFFIGKVLLFPFNWSRAQRNGSFLREKHTIGQ